VFSAESLPLRLTMIPGKHVKLNLRLISNHTNSSSRRSAILTFHPITICTSANSSRSWQ
jgi:hypothetical protein